MFIIFHAEAQEVKVFEFSSTASGNEGWVGILWCCISDIDPIVLLQCYKGLQLDRICLWPVIQLTQ